MRSLNSLLYRHIDPCFGVDRRTCVTALIFLVVFLVFETAFVEDDPRRFMMRMLADGDLLLAAVASAYWFVSQYLLFLTVLFTLASSWLLRVGYLTIFGLAVGVEYGYSTAVGRFTGFYDIATTFNTSSEQALESIRSFINPVFLVPVAGLTICCLLTARDGKRPGRIRFVCLLLLSSGFYWHLHYLNPSMFSQEFASSSYGSFCQSLVDFVILNPLSPKRLPTRETVPDLAEIGTPDNNIVFIIDESIRADHLSLNGYSRATTPYLESLQRDGLLENWGTAVSGGTLSQVSYELLITGSTPDMAESYSYEQINTLPTLFQFAKSRNYRTYIFEGQTRGYWGGNPDDLTYIDSIVSVEDLGAHDIVQSSLIDYNDERQRDMVKPWEIDGKIAGMVNEIFTRSTGNFILIYKHGGHFPYEKNYPPSEGPWKPIHTMSEQYQIGAPELGVGLLNSYDNAIAYNLDDFFRRLAPDYDNLPNNTVIVYTSDHGESFFPNGRSGHGTTAREEAMVPLFMLGLKDRDADVGFKATHANIFSSLLDLMNVRPGERRYPYAPSLFTGVGTDPVRRYYNPPPGKKVVFD